LKVALKIAIGLLFAAALYFRFAVHSALGYYPSFVASCVTILFYVFRYSKNQTGDPPNEQ
jgi:hypothetical protein